MKLGKHVSIAGGIDKAPDRALGIGCNCLQIFAKNPRGWKGRKLKEKEIIKAREKINSQGLQPLVVHNTYLINPASPRPELWAKSVKGLKDDYRRAGLLGAEFLVIHPGNHTGAGMEKGIENIVEALNQVLNEVKNDTLILLENVAEGGTAIGSNFEELLAIIKGIEEKERVALCFDTCHGYAAGYNIGDQQGMNNLLQELDIIPEKNSIRIVHLNDSVYPFGSGKDQHAHIGEGEIGLKAFEFIINHPFWRDLPFILETPWYDKQENDEDVDKILSLRKD